MGSLKQHSKEHTSKEDKSKEQFSNDKSNESGKAEPPEVDYQELKTLDYYHGFVSRGDLFSLLKKEGDFIVRISEVELSKKVKYDLILSVYSVGAGGGGIGGETYVTLMPETQMGAGGESKTRNLVIRRKKSGKYNLESGKDFETIRSLIDYHHAHPAIVKNARVVLKTPVSNQTWGFKHTDLNFDSGRKLGSGAYGYVMSGKLNLAGKHPNQGVVDVAVKVQKSAQELAASGQAEKVGKEKIKEQLREARIMRNLNHRNVVRLYGIAVLEQPLYIILELINGGELKAYLLAQKKKGTPCSQQEKMIMCRGAALGMEYLHRMGYIHRDIAARNCLYVPGERLTKISDFGLSRNSLEYRVKKNGSKLPTKWLAPETLEKVTFYAKSDVYSFGILMYEIFMDGDEPWHGTKKADVRKNIIAGIFLTMPESCPLKLRTFVQTRIFVKELTSRATASELVAFLDEPEQQTKTELKTKSKKVFFNKLFKKKKHGEKSQPDDDDKTAEG